MTQPGPTLAATCGGGAFMLFMGLLEVFLRSQCDLEDPCGRAQVSRLYILMSAGIQYIALGVVSLMMKTGGGQWNSFTWGTQKLSPVIG